MSRIKAIHLTDHFLPYGGGEIFLRDLINHLDVDFLFCVNMNKSNLGFEEFPVPVLDISEIDPSSVEADVMFFWGRVGDAPTLFLHIPVKIFIAVSDFNVQWFLGPDKYATHAVALSESTKSAIDFHGMCEVIHAGVDFDRHNAKVEKFQFRETLGFSRDDFVVGQFCRMVKFKKFEVTIEALAALDENVKLLLIGTGPNLYPILDLCEEKLHRRHQYVRYVDIDDLGTYYNCLDAFCLPSLGEGFARVQWESMYFGVPFMGTPVGGVPDVIKHGINGFVVKDEKEIREAISLLRDSKLWSSISGKAHECAMDKGTIQMTADKYMRLLRRIQGVKVL